MESIFRKAELESADVATFLNCASHAESSRALAGCLDVPRWVDAVLDSRPFAGVECLRDAIARAAKPFSGEEIQHALRVHPRIGEQPRGESADARHARAEQAGVDASDTAVAARLRAGNRAYEEQFGQVFLIRAAGRDASEILDELERRLGHDRATEMAAVEHELREIAAVRATGGVNDL